MKQWTHFAAAAVLTLTLFVVSGVLLLACMEPMEERSYDLSLLWAGEAVPEGWVYDQRAGPCSPRKAGQRRSWSRTARAVFPAQWSRDRPSTSPAC